MQSILLDRTSWDLVLDDNANIAVCTEPYSVIQDVATAVRTWAGECWYDTTLGLPYLTDIFVGPNQISILKAQAEQAALSVPLVQSAQCVALGPTASRNVGGTIFVTLTNGTITSVQF